MRPAAVARLGSWIAVAVVGTLMAPDVRPLDASVRPLTEAIALGCLSGGCIFLLLARRPIAASAFSALPRKRLFARSAALTAKSAEEEAIWRGLVLGVLVPPLGPLGAHFRIGGERFATPAAPRVRPLHDDATLKT